LTVDANVLLDLYRYHEHTRNNLISSLEKFGGRLWLSRQASEEFFRNRTKVIVGAEKTFNDANDDIKKLKGIAEATVSQLTGNRIILADISQKLSSAIDPATKEAQQSIENARRSHPKYISNDPILDRLCEMFDNGIGKDFADKEKDLLAKEAERRKKKLIPTGYLDDDKTGDRPYGDFYLWRQILDHAKEKKKAIIFVTPERKEDWWEKHSGKTTGPRHELVREAQEYSGQPVLIYQTDFFLKLASQRFNEVLAEGAVEEIRAIDNLRAEGASAVELIAQKNTNKIYFP
jgi:hypothetical protein